MRDLRIGKRTLKTAIAVVLSLMIGRFVNLQQPLMAGFSAIVVMQSSLFSSLDQGKNRLLATITGAIVACIISWSGFTNYFTIGLGTIVIILICNIFDWKGSITLGCMVMLVILVDVGDRNALVYAVNRTLDTFIGIAVGSLVNWFVFPPHPLRWIFESYASIERDLFIEFREFIEDEEEIEIHLIQEELVRVDKEYNALTNQYMVQLVKEKELAHLEEVNRLLFQVVSHMTVVGASNDNRVLSRRALKKVRRIMPDIRTHQSISSHDLYDDIYSYHIERIAELLLILREKIHAIYDDNPDAYHSMKEPVE